MKSSIVFFALYFALSLLACQDTKENFTNTSDEISSFKKVGEQIPFETGMRWMDVYKSKTRAEGRLLFSDYSISASKLDELVQSVSGFTGVAFHYGIDDNGATHILIIPIDESLSLWSSIPGRIFVDANSGNEITQSVASAWADNFKQAHPSDIWFHFFGQEIFEEMNTIPYFNTLDIQPGLNDVLLPQLLLVIWPEVVSILGRQAREDQNGVVYDASYPCPPCAIQ